MRTKILWELGTGTVPATWLWRRCLLPRSPQHASLFITSPSHIYRIFRLHTLLVSRDHPHPHQVHPSSHKIQRAISLLVSNSVFHQYTPCTYQISGFIVTPHSHKALARVNLMDVLLFKTVIIIIRLVCRGEEVGPRGVTCQCGVHII